MSSFVHLFSSCFRCTLQRVFSVAPVRLISPFPLPLDIAYMFPAPGCSMSYVPGLAKTPPWLQCDPTPPLRSPLLSSFVPPRLISPAAPPHVALPAVPPPVASLGAPPRLASSITPPCPVPPVVLIHLPPSAPPFMGNRYHIPDATKQNIFMQSAFDRQIVVAQRFGVSTRTIHCIVKNFRHYGTVSPKPPTVGRPRKLSWGDIVVR